MVVVVVLVVVVAAAAVLCISTPHPAGSSICLVEYYVPGRILYSPLDAPPRRLLGLPCRILYSPLDVPPRRLLDLPSFVFQPAIGSCAGMLVEESLWPATLS